MTILQNYEDGMPNHIPSDCILLQKEERKWSEWGVIGERLCESEECCLQHISIAQTQAACLGTQISFALKRNPRKLIKLTSLKPSLNLNMKNFKNTHNFEK